MGMLVVPVPVASVVMCGFMYVGHSGTISILSIMASENEGVVAGLQYEGTRLLIQMMIAVILNVVMVGVIGFFEIHKMAGPIYRFTKTTRQIASGSYPARFGIRTDDLPQDLASAYGEMITSLRKKAETDIRRIDEIRDRVQSMAAIIDQDRSQVASGRKAKEEIDKLLNAMQQHLSAALETPPQP